MDDARFDRPGVGDATGDARPKDGSAPNRLDQMPGVAPTRDWSRDAHDRSMSSLVLHWIDEKGAVVRLLTSSDPDTAGDGT
jgi:hypothetical protein